MSYLYILYINFVGFMICKHFLPVCRISFCLVYGLLCCAKAYKFDYVPFIFFFLCLLHWETGLRKHSCDLCQKMLFLCSLLQCHLIFKSFSYFEFTFVYDVRVCSNFIDLYVAVQFSQLHLPKRLSFLHCVFLTPLSKINGLYMCRFILGLSILWIH